MTAHNPAMRFGVDDRTCAVIDRAYNYLVVLRTAFRQERSERSQEFPNPIFPNTLQDGLSGSVSVHLPRAMLQQK